MWKLLRYFLLIHLFLLVGVVAIEKGAFGSLSTMVANLRL